MSESGGFYDDTGAYIGPRGGDPSTANMQLIQNQLASLNNRLSSMDGRLNAMDERLTSIDNRLNNSDIQMRDTDTKFFNLSRNVWILIGGLILLGWLSAPFLNAYARQVFSPDPPDPPDPQVVPLEKSVPKKSN